MRQTMTRSMPIVLICLLVSVLAPPAVSPAAAESPAAVEVTLTAISLREGEGLLGESARAGHGEVERGGQGPGEGLVVVVLVHRQERVALKEVLLAEVPELLHGDVVPVEGQRAGDVPHAVPQEVEAPPQVDVLVEHEEALVEAADPTEEVGPYEQGGPRAEQDVPGRVEGAVVDLVRLALVAHPEPGERAVDVVDAGALPVEHLRGDGVES